MREIGAFEAKNTLGALLDLVQGGEQVVITRHGKPVARLVPESSIRDRVEAKAAIERMRHRAQTRTGEAIRHDEWKALMAEGRK